VPASPPARQGDIGAGSTTPTTSPTLKVNGNNPVEWQPNTPWQDNLGALFSHDGISETVYSTSTVDTATLGTTTIDYWAEVPSTERWLHTNRSVVVQDAANDNQATSTPVVATSTPPAANDNTQIAPMAATGTDASSTQQ
jgi:hypothetical protein